MVTSLNKSEDTENIIPIIKAIMNSENFGKKLINKLTFFKKILRRMIPSTRGNITIQNVDLIKSKILRSTVCFISP